jgi:protein phosphatase
MSKAAKILNIPGSALVVLVGVAGSGKSTFANAHFLATEVLSSDFFRGMVSDDEDDQEASADAFALLRLALEKRLRRGKLCLVDATNIRAEHRARLLEYARSYKRPAIAIVFETPENICVARAASRASRIVDAAVIREQTKELAPQLDDDLLREGFVRVFRLNPAQQVEIRRTKTASRAK